MRVLLIGLLALTGCNTTIREMRDHPPRAIYVSKKSMPALEECLADSLSWIASPSIIRGEATTSIALGSGGSTALLVTLRPLPTGVEVAVRQLLVYGTRVRNNVQGCI